MIYAFDYDGVLDNAQIQDFVLKVRQQGNELWVCTMRSDNDFNNNVMKPVLDKLGLNKRSVIFCSGKAKWEYLQGINADIYIDNITDEFEILKNHTNVVPLLWV